MYVSILMQSPSPFVIIFTVIRQISMKNALLCVDLILWKRYLLSLFLLKIGDEAMGVDVGTCEVVVVLGEEILSFLCCFFSVDSEEGGYVELEEDVHLLEVSVVLLIHIYIAFGMGKDWSDAFELYGHEGVLELEWGIEI